MPSVSNIRSIICQWTGLRQSLISANFVMIAVAGRLLRSPCHPPAPSRALPVLPGRERRRAGQPPSRPARLDPPRRPRNAARPAVVMRRPQAPPVPDGAGARTGVRRPRPGGAKGQPGRASVTPVSKAPDLPDGAGTGDPRRRRNGGPPSAPERRTPDGAGTRATAATAPTVSDICDVGNLRERAGRDHVGTHAGPAGRPRAASDLRGRGRGTEEAWNAARRARRCLYSAPGRNPMSARARGRAPHAAAPGVP